MKKIIEKIMNHKVIFVIAVTITIPIFVNILMSYSAPWTKGGIEDWIPFYGGFAGGIITLIALFITLHHNEDIQKSTRHDMVRPYIKAWHLNGAVDYKRYEKEAYNYCLVYEGNDNIFKKKVGFNKQTEESRDPISWFEQKLVLENVGVGVAINYKLFIKSSDHKQCEAVVNDSLEKDGKIIYHFSIAENFLSPQKYTLIIKYQDILRKKYYQRITFEIIENTTGEVSGKYILKDFIFASEQFEDEE